MADIDHDQKTEAATPKRRQDSARKGDVLASRELSTALMMLAGTGWLALAGGWAVNSWGQMLRTGLRFDAASLRDFTLSGHVMRLLSWALPPLLALLAASLMAAVAAPAVLGALGFRAAAFAPKASRIDPGAGLKRIFGPQGLMELGKALLKVSFLGAMGWWAIAGDIGHMQGLAHADAQNAAASAGAMLIKLLLALSLALGLIAAVDVPIQIYQRNARLRMSKQEVRDEQKESEGAPEKKTAIRNRQHAILTGSARKAVSDASVILTNPTHFAVALRYRPGLDAAPIVVARGRGATAQAIRDLGTAEGVPLLDYPQLTRAIYFTTRAGQPISQDLYVAVATILAFVFNLDAAMAQPTDRPQVDVPEDKRFDAHGRPSP